MKCRIDSGLDAPMVAVDRFVSADLRILEAIGLLLCREKLDVLAKSALVAFECENIVGLLGQNFRRDVALAAHRVDSHDSAFDRQHPEQRRDRDDFVGLLRHLDLPKHQSLARRERRNHMDRLLRTLLGSARIASDPASTARRHKSNTSSSGYSTLPRCRGSGKSLK